MSQAPTKKPKKSKNPKGSKEVSRYQKTISCAPSKMGNVTSPSTATSKTPNAIDTSKRKKKASRRNKSSKDAATKEESSPKEKKKKLNVAMIETCEGKKLEVVSHLRNPGNHAEFFVKDENKEILMLRFEPSKKGKLRFLNEILTETKKAVGEEKIPIINTIEYGTNQGLGLNYLVLTPHGIQVGEIIKVAKQLTPACALNVALQSLEALRYLHKAGFIHRNVKPASFSIGYGPNESKVMLSDYRLSRTHIDSSTKAPKKARPTVHYCGTCRYASITCLKEGEQGRKDDLESWMYMLYDMFDPVNGLSWRRMPRCNMLIKEKENFKTHVHPNTYKIIPEEFKKIVETIHSWVYETTPDYDMLKEIVENVARARNYDLTTCDWAGKITAEVMANAVKLGLKRSTGNVCSGQDDFEHGKKKHTRKIMSPEDTIKNGQFVWKVVNLLGSGGFGDVYKVYDERNNKRHYALKTESDEGKKVMLRLKVEMQVMMAFTEGRKAGKNFCHFVEFVDRGKSDDLKCKFIVMSLVGPSLDDCRRKYGVPMNKGVTPFIVAIQSLEAVRDLHSLGYLHRDIKPANFAVGFGEQEPMVFMLDFGIGRSFLDPKTKEHRAPRKSVKFLGTLRYASRACMKGIDQGRKDDVECWIYMVVDIFDPENGIAWKDARGRDAITQAKDYFFDCRLSKYFKEQPCNIKEIIRYVNKLQFQEPPDYSFLIDKLLFAHTGKSGKTINLMSGGWIGKLKNKVKTTRFADSESETEKFSGSGETE